MPQQPKIAILHNFKSGNMWFVDLYIGRFAHCSHLTSDFAPEYRVVMWIVTLLLFDIRYYFFMICGEFLFLDETLKA